MPLSDFVATRILHELYDSCCAKRFRRDPVSEEKPVRRPTLYKYLVIPKEEQTPSQAQLSQPKTPDLDSAPKTNPFAPRSSSKDNQSSETLQSEPKRRSRSGTFPFIETTEAQQQLSKRSQSRPKQDEEEEQ